MAKRKGIASGKEGTPTVPPFPEVGFQIGEYVIKRILGNGSMSTVFLARDGTGHEVALKVFQEGPNVSTTMIERFRREAEASKQLRHHPNIITVFATGQEGTCHYIAMQRIIDGMTLELLMEKERLTIERVVRMTIKLARALAHAHSRNIIHRDIKPCNIMIDQFGEPLLADFGVAALVEWPKFTVAGALTGTPLYMSPEQAQGKTVGQASDLYSLGVVLYEALTGVLPYSTHHFSAVHDTLKAVQNEQVRRPRAFREEISEELQAVVMHTLAKNPKDRYPDGEAFARDLEKAIEGRPVNARHYTWFTNLSHRIWRHRRALQLLSTAIFVLLVVMVYFLRLLQDVQFQSLIGSARLHNSQYVLDRLTRSRSEVVNTPRELQEIRLARRDMARNDWTKAISTLSDVVKLSTTDGDSRSIAMAYLELARCSTMVGQHQQATTYYRRVLTNPDASPSIVGLAQLESALLVILEGDKKELETILSSRIIPPTNPISNALRLVRGDLEIKQSIPLVHSSPEYLQNDIYLTAAVLARNTGNFREAAMYLQSSISSSRPESEWPAPFARRLQAGVSK